MLIRQWRYPAKRALWELPAGTREEGGTPIQTATRELSEETGYSAATWTPLGSFFLAPGYSTEVMHLFLATDLIAGDAHTEDDETLDVMTWEIPALRRLIADNAVDMKTVAGLALAGVSVR